MTDLELLVVDDASPEPAVEALDGVLDERGRVLRLSTNQGQAAARNRGIRETTGAWIAFLDDDDEWLPSHLAGLLAAAGRDPTAGVAYRPYLIGYRDRVARHHIPTPTGDVFPALARGWSPALSSGLMVRREFGIPGFDTTLVGIEDYDWWLSLAQRTHFTCHPSPQVIVDKTPRPDRTTMQVARRREAIATLAAKWMPVMRELGLGYDFQGTCTRLELVASLTTGLPAQDLGGRARAAIKALSTPGLPPRTRLAGALRMAVGSELATRLQSAWFLARGIPRSRVTE